MVGIDSLNDYHTVQLKHDRLAWLTARGSGQGRGFAFEQVGFADHEALERALDGHSFDRIVHLGAQAGVRYSITNPAPTFRPTWSGTST